MITENTNNQIKKYKYRIWFSRWGQAKYLSQHDTALILEQAFRRANFSVGLSGQFNPRMKISFYSALPIGIASKGEPIDVTLTNEMPCDKFLQQLNEQLPSETAIVKVERFTGKEKYWLEILSKVTMNHIDLNIDSKHLLAQQNLLVYRKRLQKEVDIQPFLKNIEIDNTSSQFTTLYITTLLTFKGSTSVWEILELLHINVDELSHLEITREKITLLPPIETK